MYASESYAITAPGEDGIPAEGYKTFLDSLDPCLHGMITKVWLCEAVPNNRSEADILPLFKKGDKRICSYYRGIRLIDVALKVFGEISIRERPAHSPKKVVLGLDVDARIGCTTYVLH